MGFYFGFVEKFLELNPEEKNAKLHRFDATTMMVEWTRVAEPISTSVVNIRQACCA